MTKELGGSALGTKPRLTVASFSSGVARPTVSRANVRSKNRVVPLLSGPSTHRRRSLTSVPSGLAAVVPAEDRHVRRVRSRLRRAYVLLACLLGLVVLLTVVQESWLWTVDQAAHKAHSAEGGYGDGTPILLLVLVKQFLCAAVAISFLFAHTLAIVRYRRMLHRAREVGAPEQDAVPADHWTAVASRDIFEETAQLVGRAQLIVYTSIGGSTVAATAAQVRNTLMKNATVEGACSIVQACCPGCQPFEVGCPCDTLCQASNSSLEAFLTFNIGVITCLITSVVFIPLPIWSPVADAAFSPALLPSKLHFTVLKRTRALPIPLTALTMVIIGVFAVYAIHVVAPGLVHGVVIWQVVLVINVCASLGLLGLLAWTAGVYRVVTLPVSLLRTCASALHGAVSQCTGSTKTREGGRRLGTISHLWRCQSSSRYRQLALLCSCIYCFSIEAVNVRAGRAYELYIIRAISLLLLLLVRDAEAEPEQLEIEGAGFGLLVSATHLAAALRAHLAGQPYAGRMPRYKATELRMQDTLAVSYRWHDEARMPLGQSGLALNITDWQAASLLAGLRTVGCRYVWIDNLAIPANAPGIQRTLLNRMMAVYSSALATLVLRSAESDGGRYHQRVWTLQEFCAAGLMMVMTEEDGKGGGEDGLAAVLGSEGEVMEALRREHVRRLAECEPVWLSEGGAIGAMRRIPGADVARIWATYGSLSAGLHCRYRADMVRALYPLLWNRPAESEAELVMLLRALQSEHGIPQGALLSMLKQSSTRNFKQSQDRIDEEVLLEDDVSNEEAPWAWPLPDVAAIAQVPLEGRLPVVMEPDALHMSGSCELAAAD